MHKIGFLGLLSIALIVLKVTGFISSWFWALLPIILIFSIWGFCAFCFFGFIALIAWFEK